MAAEEQNSKSYEQRLEEARPLVGFPGCDIEGDIALKLVGLVCTLTQVYRKKTPETKPFHVITKIYGKANTNACREWYMTLSILCEIFLTPDAKFSSYGLKSIEEISEEIKRILGLWLPF